MISRRSFLLGLGSLVTASFAARAQAYALTEGVPLLLDPGPVEKTLYLYEGLDPGEGEWGNKWRLSLGPWQQVHQILPLGASICASRATAPIPQTILIVSGGRDG
jgi:hypothetical protein